MARQAIVPRSSWAHRRRRRPPSRRLSLLVAMVATATTARASTTSVFYDGQDNLAADPFPFLSLAASGEDNTAVGQRMMADLTTGFNNIAIGKFALQNVTTGDQNRSRLIVHTAGRGVG